MKRAIEETAPPLLVTTRVAAKAIGIGGGTLKAMARTRPGFPQPIPLLSTHPKKRQFRWPLAALREYFAREYSARANTLSEKAANLLAK
jgi:hypothetical protein